ncbi:FtsZ/tubulin family protein [Natronolimnohabitans innermongolicus]|uniref:Tubulin-like protein CetZ n=1 Tax=Natronolimnohabitans innermongolicus JCM 12255 TaxID=1227499 RepID=L9WZ50_9EURY|nr:cell division protein FtsZ [Natronolimnohabitans innermongolicus]ELY54446.1 Tubulin/FtsZ GTPase [Natronolimnohabitans innermongolicus JCM 12255]
MQLEVIGVGGAGCRIADAIRAAEPATHGFLTDVFVFDTDDSALERTVVPESHRHRYGQGTGLETGDDADLERRFDLGETHADELLEALERGSPAAADAVLVTVGLGGATGGGVAPALVAALQRAYDAPVYVLATLPATREFDPDADDGTGTASSPHSGGVRADAGGPPRPDAAAYAGSTLERLDGLASAIIAFDNEEWLRPGETLADARDRCNRELARRVTAVFAGGGAGDGEGPVAQTVLDASDLERVLGNGSAVVALGYGDQTVETTDSRFGLGLLPTEREVETAEAVSAVETVVRKGIHGKSSLECESATADRGLLIVGGPPNWLNRQAIAEGRRALESTVGEGVLGGDAPRPDTETVFAAVVLAGVESDRLEELRDIGARTN